MDTRGPNRRGDASCGPMNKDYRWRAGGRHHAEVSSVPPPPRNAHHAMYWAELFNVAVSAGAGLCFRSSVHPAQVDKSPARGFGHDPMSVDSSDSPCTPHQATSSKNLANTSTAQCKYFPSSVLEIFQLFVRCIAFADRYLFASEREK